MNKSIINQFIEMFCKLSTAIFLFSSIYIFCFNGMEGMLSVEYIWGVLGLAFLLTLARIPFFSEKEYNKKAYIALNIFYFIFTNTAVLVCGFFLRWFSLKHPITIIGMEITYVIVYAVVWFLIYISMKNSANKMNEQLKKIKNS